MIWSHMINLDRLSRLSVFENINKNRCFSSIFILFITSCSIPSIYEIHGETMGTTYTIRIFGPLNHDHIEILKTNIDSVLNKVNQHFSTYISDSEISKVNASSTLSSIEVTPDFFDLMHICSKIHSLSDGFFDPTVSPLVELWGFGTKGITLKPP